MWVSISISTELKYILRNFEKKYGMLFHESYKLYELHFVLYI